MKSDRILAIKNLVFNLPDGFNGDLTDALELLVKYRRSDEAIKKRQLGNQGAKVYDTVQEAVDAIWNDENYKCHMEALILGYENDNWFSLLDDNNKLK